MLHLRPFNRWIVLPSAVQAGDYNTTPTQIVSSCCGVSKENKVTQS